jgi:hypothetical protein
MRIGKFFLGLTVIVCGTILIEKPMEGIKHGICG